MTSPLAAILCLSGILLAVVGYDDAIGIVIFLIGVAVELAAHSSTPAD